MSFKHFLLPVLFLTLTSISRADTYLYTLTGTENVTFELDSNQSTWDNGRINNVTIHTASGSQVGYVGFFASLYGGGIYDQFDGAGFYGHFNQQFYSDTPSGPVLDLGVFQGSSSSGSGPFDELITVTDVSIAPEPSSFVLLGTGITFVGSMARRKLQRHA